MTFKQKTDWLISMHAGIVPSDLENEMNPFFSWFLWSNFENTDIFDAHRPSPQSRGHRFNSGALDFASAFTPDHQESIA